MNLPHLDQFSLKTFDKVRYADTDRQGHVNNAVFATMLETDRVEILYDPDNPLASEHCAFVIVSLTLNFQSELNWPGRVEIGTRVSAIGRSSVTPLCQHADGINEAFEQMAFQQKKLKYFRIH